ncbi:MAG: putative membrane protein [Halorubrum sp. J07HR59]|nr:MAG: putative membrane protein [Halorubrum sp. J07HR59]
MKLRLRRAGGFAIVSTLALAAPALGRAAAIPFAAVAAAAVFGIREGQLFELFARPGDHEEGQLGGLAGFALAAAGLALFATLPSVPMPPEVFAAAVLVVAFGNLGQQFVRESTSDEILRVAGFLGAGFLAATAAQVAVTVQAGQPVDLPLAAFLAAVAALIAGLLRSVLYERDDPLVILSVGFVLWLFASLATDIAAPTMAFALGVTAGLGYISYALETASVPGMLTGVLLGLLTVVLGGFGWFAALIAFFSIGGLASKYRYEEKAARGVAQEDGGARGTGNVLANSAVALVAVVGAAAVEQLPVSTEIFALVFAGAVATAMSDTLSSEVGGLFDSPRLVTTLRPVAPGTDGAVSPQGTLAGTAGALLVAGIAAVGMPLGDPTVGGLAVAAGGILGTVVDSLLGATVEGGRVGNQTVNLLATLSGALVAVAIGTLV